MTARGRLLDVGLGLVYLTVAGALVLTSVLVYLQTFTDTVEVELTTGSVGNNLRPGTDVKVRGVQVGRVADIEVSDTGAVLTLALDPDRTGAIPADVKARLLPKTLFGERYVALQVPAGTDLEVADPIADGDRIGQDTSREAVELEQVFDELLPVLTAVQPEKISATLSELVALLRGNGADLGDTMAEWTAYVRKLNPEIPQLTDDLGALGRVAGNYSEALPDLLTALDDVSVTSATLVDERAQLQTLFSAVVSSADTTRGWLDANEDTIRVLSAESRRALRAVEPYAEEFPCVMASARKFVPAMDAQLGAGTGRPGLRIEVTVVPDPGPYIAGRDEVTYASGATASGPSCPYVPSDARAVDPAPARRGAAPAARSFPQATGLGPTNSPDENQLTAELFAGRLGVRPSGFPSWGTLMLGPLVRGTEVTLR
ncbi:MCE family protein [Nocardioides plantarum]|uniref:MCE family protein n=1 Tax=Nocardioides plantarum TaxID=29299 RepID=A0ABV5KF89_9ACTN|nr:MCE family protein [Nocardioides plantarum]